MTNNGFFNCFQVSGIGKVKFNCVHLLLYKVQDIE